jgi:hypothetical protein
VGEEGYAPWPTEILDAELRWPGTFTDRPDIGQLWFKSPEDGHPVSIFVSQEPNGGEQISGTNIWHIELASHDAAPGERIVVSPSIHFIGHFHSPNPVTFNLVPELSAE